MEKELTACTECGAVYLRPIGPPAECHGCGGDEFTPIEPKDLLPRAPPRKWERYLS